MFAPRWIFLEGKPLGACTEFAIPEVHSGIFIDEGCAINRAYWDWKKTGGAVAEFEEVGRAVFKILEDPWGGTPIYLADGEQVARKEKGTVAVVGSCRAVGNLSLCHISVWNV